MRRAWLGPSVWKGERAGGNEGAEYGERCVIAYWGEDGKHCHVQLTMRGLCECDTITVQS